MTVKELREILADIPDTHVVVLSRDPEGNGYAPASGDLAEGIYDESEREFVHYVDDIEAREQTPSDFNAFCIWPIY